MTLSEESERNATCNTKVRHDSFKSASKHISNPLNGKKKKLGKRIIPYLCKFCSGWHVGHGYEK